MNLKTVNPTKLNPHPDNPNQHPEAQIDALGDSLDKFDQVKNIVVWNDTIIAGHAFVQAAIRAGRETLQAHDVSHLSYEQATALMLADIRLPDMAFVDDEVMAEALRAIEQPLDIPGFDEDFLEGLPGWEPEPPEEGPEIIPDQFLIMIECHSEADQLKVLDELTEQGYTCKALIS
jgi:ParB-like chromosome segregation protein Spo0J